MIGLLITVLRMTLSPEILLDAINYFIWCSIKLVVFLEKAMPIFPFSTLLCSVNV